MAFGSKVPSLSILNRVLGDWDSAKGYLKKDLQAIQKWARSLPQPPTHFTPRVVSMQTSAMPAINVSTTDVFELLQQASPILSFTSALQGTPVDGQSLTIRILDNGTPQAITWGAKFVSNGATLPTTTIANTVMYVVCQYNAAQGLWECLAVGNGSGSAPGQALTEVNDTNVTLSLGGTPSTALLQAVSLTLGWTGTLAAGRLNSNVVQSVVNDTNVTGSISAQALTLGWSGKLGLARGGTNADLSGTGGAHNFLRQNSSGAAVDVVQPAATDLSDYVGPTSWTPTDASGAGLAFTSVVARYIKIGKFVMVSAQLVYPTTANTSSALIGGLPFTIESPGANLYGCAPYISTLGTPVTIFPSAGTTTVFLVAPSNGGAYSNANMSTQQIRFTMTYIST